MIKLTQYVASTEWKAPTKEDETVGKYVTVTTETPIWVNPLRVLTISSRMAFAGMNEGGDTLEILKTFVTLGGEEYIVVNETTHEVAQRVENAT